MIAQVVVYPTTIRSRPRRAPILHGIVKPVYKGTEVNIKMCPLYRGSNLYYIYNTLNAVNKTALLETVICYTGAF